MSEEKEIKGKDDLIDFLKEVWPLWVVYISTFFTFIVFLKSFYGNPPDSPTIILYFTLALIGTISFIVLLVSVYFRRKKISSKYTCHIIEEKDEYDLQLHNGKINAICRQNLKIKVMANMKDLQTFYPLYGTPPIKCETIDPDGNTYIVDSSRLPSEPYGLKLHLKRQYLKTEEDELHPIIWEYKGLQAENAIRTSIVARPTEKLKIFISLPPDKPKPKKHEWQSINTEGESISCPKRTECFQSANRYCLSVQIKAKEGLRYRIFWEY